MFTSEAIFKLLLYRNLSLNDFQQCEIMTSVDSDEPVSFLLRLETQNDVLSVA